MNRLTRDDTIHGVEYVRAVEAEMEIETLRHQVHIYREEIKNLRDVQGRHNTAIAMERLFKLIEP